MVKVFNCTHKTRKNNLKRILKKSKLALKKTKKYSTKIDLYDLKEKLRHLPNIFLLEYICKYKKREIKFNPEDIIYKIKIPSDFSLVSNPTESLEVINKLICLYENRKQLKITTIHFDYSDCKNLELGILTLKNVITLSLDKLGYNFEGELPTSEDSYLLSLLFFSGIFDAFKKNPHDFLDYKAPPHKTLLFGGGKNKPDINCSKMILGGVTETKISDWFNECLKKNGFCFAEKGIRKIDKILGEIFSNCDEHSGDEINQYYCRAHYHHGEDNIGRVNIVIFNFGQTISDGLENSTNLPVEVKTRMELLIKKHEKKFLIIPNWERESLLTLFSLQNEISRLYDEKKTRGTGTVKFIELFLELGQSLNSNYIPKLSIISGNTQILIDNSEICKINEDRNITFNKENTLDVQPSDKYVKKINNYFPGTIISLDIFLDKEYIKEKKNAKS